MTAGSVSAPHIIPIMHLQTHRAKNRIDSSTRVSIQSDTPGVLIFYTLDGSKPMTMRRGSAGSRKYSEPLLLPAGRITVRAVAITSDGRESSVVTKVFSVEHVELKAKENEQNILQNDQQHPSEGTSCFAENSGGSSLRPQEWRMTGNVSTRSGPHFMTSRMDSPSTAAKTGSCRYSESESSGVLTQLDSKQTSRINQETDFLRCPGCGFRPSDPFARFCLQCGAVLPPLPEQRLPPAEIGQASCCVLCRTVVPINTQSRFICQQLQPRPSLTPQAVQDGNSAPAVPSAHGRMLTCSKRNCVNRHDARYSDCCVSKPRHTASCVICWRCGASGQPYTYCTACGIFLEPQTPPTFYSDITKPVDSTPDDQASHDATPTSNPTPKMRLTTPTAEKNTQTVGLYYPSTTELQKKEQQRALQVSRQQATRDRQPLLTAISPGRGYWRQQLDHVCAHLRSYAQNNAPFRALLGEPRLGRMVSAVIQEDPCGVTLTVSFMSALHEVEQVDPPDDAVGPTPDVTEMLSRVTEGPADSSSLRGNQSTGVMKPPLTPKRPVKDIQLLKELGPGRGQIAIVQQLLDQGADPTCCSRDGRHALVVAVVNGHHDVVPLLVQRGADVDQQSGRMNTSALHEAAALGPEGLLCARALLSCKASTTRRNADGQTAYDVAVKSGCNNMVSLLAAQTGLDFLGKLGGAKVNLDVF